MVKNIKSIVLNFCVFIWIPLMGMTVEHQRLIESVAEDIMIFECGDIPERYFNPLVSVLCSKCSIFSSPTRVAIDFDPNPVDFLIYLRDVVADNTNDLAYQQKVILAAIHALNNHQHSDYRYYMPILFGHNSIESLCAFVFLQPISLRREKNKTLLPIQSKGSLFEPNDQEPPGLFHCTSFEELNAYSQALIESFNQVEEQNKKNNEQALLKAYCYLNDNYNVFLSISDCHEMILDRDEKRIFQGTSLDMSNCINQKGLLATEFNALITSVLAGNKACIIVQVKDSIDDDVEHYLVFGLLVKEKKADVVYLPDRLVNEQYADTGAKFAQAFKNFLEKKIKRMG